jgi:hypothetical protein
LRLNPILSGFRSWATYLSFMQPPGCQIAGCKGAMPIRRSPDRRAASIPQIRADGGSVTFHLDVAGVDHDVSPTIRCDADGEVRVSLTPKHARSA